MNQFNKTILPILLTGIWINVSETIRWIFLVKSQWIEHYQKMNLVFPTEPVNGMTWMIWGFLLAISIFIISRKFNLIQTTLISWFLAFIMLWMVLWNIAVFPINIIWIVVPLSLLEVFVGTLICRKISPA
jgi:hypothetical protein